MNYDLVYVDLRDNFRGCRAAASYQDEVVQVLVAQLLPGPVLARRLPAPLQLGLHVGLEVARLKNRCASSCRDGKFKNSH